MGSMEIFRANLGHPLSGVRIEATNKKILGLKNLEVNVCPSIADDDKGDTKVEDLEGDDMKD